MSVGSTATDSLEQVGDHDWFRITLTAGQAVVITVDGVTLTDPYLTVRDSAGNVLFTNDDILDGINRNSRVAFSPTYTGTYYIDVSAFNDQYAGTYQVSVQPYTPPPVATYGQIADQLVNGFWGGDSHHFNVTQGGTITVNISTLTATEQALARSTLQQWSDIIGVHFQEVATGGQIVFDDSEDSSGPIAATDAIWSNGIISSAHVHISTSWITQYGSAQNTYGYQSYLHEIGHALGLGHSGDYNNDARFPYDASFLNDAWSTTVMSYFDQRENTYFKGQGFTENFDTTPMVADILAMQQLYGLSTTTRAGDTTYSFGGSHSGAQCIFDSGGTDWLYATGYSGTQLINLNPGTFSNISGDVGNVSIALGTIIENAVGGAGADTILGNDANNYLEGGQGSDNINGGAGDDTLVGDGPSASVFSADTLTGGAGKDTFLDSAAGHNGDTITDFSAGDKIVFTDATLAGFSFSLSGNTLTYSGGSLTLSNVPTGHLVASAAAGGGVQLMVSRHAVHDDFNGDGRSDLLWLTDGGTIFDFLGTANGGFANNGDSSAISLGAGWHVGAVGDLNGDGKADLLLRNDNGAIFDVLGTANGGFTNNGDASYVAMANSWHIAGVGDFDGDGREDILWRNDNGAIFDMLGASNGGVTNNGDASSISVATSWSVAGIGDFNGDGRDDILWRNSNGAIFDMLGTNTGGFTSNGDNSSVSMTASWHVAGIGDFNGDGRSDILWRNDNGAIFDMLGTSNGGFTSNGDASYVAVDNSWHVASVGDFNGDGRSDILWRNDNGAIFDMLGTANGGFINNGDNSFVNVPTTSHVQDLLF